MLIIPITFGEKQNNDDVPMPTHFDRQVSDSAKNKDDLKTICIACYRNCQEHFHCFVAKWINIRSNIDTLLNRTDKNIYRPLLWKDLYASLQFCHYYFGFGFGFRCSRISCCC